MCSGNCSAAPRCPIEKSERLNGPLAHDSKRSLSGPSCMSFTRKKGRGPSWMRRVLAVLAAQRAGRAERGGRSQRPHQPRRADARGKSSDRIARQPSGRNPIGLANELPRRTWVRTMTAVHGGTLLPRSVDDRRDELESGLFRARNAGVSGRAPSRAAGGTFGGRNHTSVPRGGRPHVTSIRQMPPFLNGSGRPAPTRCAAR